MFHRRFPEKFISPMRICRLYKANNITMKKFQRVKRYSLFQVQRKHVFAKEVMEKLESMKRESRKMIYVDEICFTKRTVASHTYSSQYSRMMIDENKLYTQPMYALASISEARGVEHVQYQS